MYARFARRFSQRSVLNISHRDATHVLKTANRGRFLETISNRSIDNLTKNACFSILSPCQTDTTMSNKNEINYEQLLEVQNDRNALIVDVREQSEIRETGKLPGSIHIPMGDVSDVLLNLSDKQFQERYGKYKPTKDTKIIFSCLAGKRSRVVQQEMRKLGFKNVYNYNGGWQDWARKQRI